MESKEKSNDAISMYLPNPCIPCAVAIGVTQLFLPN